MSEEATSEVSATADVRSLNAWLEAASCLRWEECKSVTDRARWCCVRLMRAGYTAALITYDGANRNIEVEEVLVSSDIQALGTTYDDETGECVDPIDIKGNYAAWERSLEHYTELRPDTGSDGFDLTAFRRLKEVAIDLTLQHQPGWHRNEGGDGVVIFNALRGAVRVEHSQKIIEVHESTETFEF